MHFITHFVAAIAFAAYFDISHPFIFIASAVLIDLDHIYEVIASEGFQKQHIYNIFSFNTINYLEPQKQVHLLHTFEVLALLFILGNFHFIFKWIFLGFIFHMALDAIGNIYNRNFGKSGAKDWIKHWFLTYYLLKFTGKAK